MTPQTRPTRPRPESAGSDQIVLRGVRVHNLAGLDLDLPKGALIAVTGVSGSGKSSLAFDTLFREGQRRFLETLSAYARQFLGRMEKPDIERAEGLLPAIAVEQKTLSRSARSTVGTLTEIHDHLRVLYARAGVPHCPDHDVPLEAQTPGQVLDRVTDRFADQPIHVLAPLVRDRKGQHRTLLEDLAKRGFARVRVDGEIRRIEEVPELERYKRHTVEVVVDRLKATEENVGRLREAIAAAIELGEGDLAVLGDSGEATYSTRHTCPSCGREAPPLEPRLFSFNSPHGACEDCGGLGTLRRPTEASVVGDPTLTIREGALAVTRSSGGALLFPRVDFDFLDQVAYTHDFDLDTPWRELPTEARRVVLFGTGEERFEDTMNWNGRRYQGSAKWKRRYDGVIGALEKAAGEGKRKKMVDRFLSISTCPTCAGSRLGAVPRSVKLDTITLPDLLGRPVGELEQALDDLPLAGRQRRIAEPLVAEIRHRLRFLSRVGLGYLSLSRAADTLSGGEAQRIRLAAQLGAGLQGVMYVLDEPSVGLHARDHGKLLGALCDLRDQGNTVVVVEHDEATLRAADHVVDIGPGAGRHGGRLCGVGTPDDIAKVDSPTGRLLRGELVMPAPDVRRVGDGRVVHLTGATGFNLKGVDLELRLGTFTAVGGISGSGKSTLVNRTLLRALTRKLGRECPDPEPYDRLVGAEAIEDLVVVDASPIGRTPRSNPATYSGAFTPIRDLFAQHPDARMQGWGPGRFSFNVAGGRCETCQGAGARLIELQFLAPVTVVCEDCGGHRFNPETLDVRFKGASIADVLAMTIDDAGAFFADQPKIARPLAALSEVGVGYLSLGQPSTTLSGGEAQRVKLAKYLQRQPNKHTLFTLDEPTTGLHASDVAKLLEALQKLVDKGHTVLVIEHHLDVLRAADRLIDLGPEGGHAGGELIAQGTPEDVMAEPRSATGRALNGDTFAELTATTGPRPTPRTRIEIRGAYAHNLKHVDADIDIGSFTVVTGPSGSGKSSLALDTLYAAGRQRFVESLSTYARQFLASSDRPLVDRIDGLAPTVAVEARTAQGSPRSTIATTTEIHDLVRVLWARAGSAHCPEHGERLEPVSPSLAARRVLTELEGSRGYVLAPVSAALSPSTTPAAFADEHAESWLKAGFARVLVDGVEQRLDAERSASGKGPWRGAERIDLVVDRLTFDEGSRARLADACEQAAHLAGGRYSVAVKDGERREFSTVGACSQCGFALTEKLEPRHFSFNTPVGACPTCDGLGASWQCDADVLIDSPSQPLIASKSGEATSISGKLGRYLTKGKGYHEHLLRAVAAEHGVEVTKPFDSLPKKHRELLLFGTGAKAQYRVEITKESQNFELEENFSAEWTGLCGAIDRWHERSEDVEWRGILEKVMTRRGCPTCKGERLAPAPRHARVARTRMPEFLERSIDAAATWLEGLRLAKSARETVAQVVHELRTRLGLLQRVGLGYLTLDRRADTLSGGEARRVRLAASLGSQLTGVCYVLDEPTVGLHPRDIDRLVDALEHLRDLGNTVVVVEHDESVMRRADRLIDMGPGAGRHGGQVVASGTPSEVAGHATSATARALRGEIDLLKLRRDLPAGERVGVEGARGRNLKKVDLIVPFGQITGVCGPSGSGKSTLVLERFVPALRGEDPEGRWRGVVGANNRAPRRVVVVDSSPLGRTPASVPATAVGFMEPLRELFARTPEARMRGFGPSHFSFNSPRGRCPACDGRGAVKVEMQFLSDLWLTCEECVGRRYKPEVLEARFRGKNVADVLEMPAEEALELLEHQPELARTLEALVRVGLGYIALGQSSTTLSGGEAQRVKLARELLDAAKGERSVVVLDEPSTGLHAGDVEHLALVLHELAAKGNAVVLIEHHTELLRSCHGLVELGPEGGEGGGRILAVGTPEELALGDTPTAPFLVAPTPVVKAAARKGAGAKSGTAQKKAAKKTSKSTTKKQSTGRASGSTGEVRP
ncbi:UvrABC system protein A [Planctomycetes bacterium Pla163]|uniref:UvrABC system protein A n=1 Tax=Rohdeia mirabilis TaxID=2528008 RepID=A0A518D0F9_9BACT|nr:UvrABC system protein A [Planctomycetes bacterium Pla163]